MSDEFKINNFDLLRIFAATQVMLYHSLVHLKIPRPDWIEVINFFPGVPMFFVISGFLISASFERNSNLIKYFRNRFLRIYPALWVCIFVTIPVIYFVSNSSLNNWIAVKWVLCQCIGLNYTPVFLKNYGFGSYNGSLWTIPIELQFYVIWPVTSFFVKIFKTHKTQTLVLLLIFLIFTGIKYYISRHFTPLNVFDETRIEKLLRYSFLPHIYLFFFLVLYYKEWLFINPGLFIIKDIFG